MGELKRILLAEDNPEDVELTLAALKEHQLVNESYRLGVNAYVVKPVDFREFILAVKSLGLFWAVFNEPPPESLARTGLR
jgi:DNA-binding NarL/FixJ family response regulator